MKFVCNICGELVTVEDVILDIRDINGFRLGIDVYCPACYEKIQEEKKRRVEAVIQKYKEKKEKKSKRWWRKK